MKNLFTLFVLILRIIFRATFDFLKYLKRIEKDNIFVLGLFLKNEHTQFEIHKWETLSYEFKKRKINLPVNTMFAVLLALILIKFFPPQEYFVFNGFMCGVFLFLGILFDFFFSNLKRYKCFGLDEFIPKGDF